MANEENTISTETPKNVGETVLEEVVNALGSSGDEVRNRLVSTLVEREVVKRVDLLDKALVRRAQLTVEVKKIRAPKRYKLEEGKMVEVDAILTKEEAETYTKTLREASEKLENFDKALEIAITKPTKEAYEKLAKLLGGENKSKETEPKKEV